VTTKQRRKTKPKNQKILKYYLNNYNEKNNTQFENTTTHHNTLALQHRKNIITTRKHDDFKHLSALMATKNSQVEETIVVGQLKP